MTHVNTASLRNEPSARLLIGLQLASVFLQIGHKVFPKARLLAVSNVADAFTLLLSPTADLLSDVHMAVATDLSLQKIDQQRRSADIINPIKSESDVSPSGDGFSPLE